MVLALPRYSGAYLWKLHRRRKQAVRYSSVALLRTVIPKGHVATSPVPVALLLVISRTRARSRPQIGAMCRSEHVDHPALVIALDVLTDVRRIGRGRAGRGAQVRREQHDDAHRYRRVLGVAQLAVPPTSDASRLSAIED